MSLNARTHQFMLDIVQAAIRFISSSLPPDQSAAFNSSPWVTEMKEMQARSLTREEFLSLCLTSYVGLLRTTMMVRLPESPEVVDAFVESAVNTFLSLCVEDRPILSTSSLQCFGLQPPDSQ